MLILPIVPLLGQGVTAGETIQVTVQAEGYYNFPQFSPDGDNLFFSGPYYQGIYERSLQGGSIDQITNAVGAGYEFRLSPDGKKIVYRTDEYDGLKKLSSLIVQDIATGEQHYLESKGRFVSMPDVTSSGDLFYTVNYKLRTAVANLTSQPESSVSEGSYVMINNSKILLFIDGSANVLAPLGDGHYINPAISPDGTKLLFTYAGVGTFISDLQGNIISELGYANAPRWSPDGNWILCMKDYDDGHMYTESDIYLISADGSETVRLTNTADRIEMYPRWSPDGSMVTYHSTEGEIFITTLQFD
jgi:Tol biopolymer transport system component